MDSRIFFSGISDEASPHLAGQIAAHRDLGWRHIELRNIGGINLTDLPDDEFLTAADALDLAGLQVSCFASQIANWSRAIDGDFEKDLLELRRAIPRMHRLRTPLIRCMSWPNSTDALPDTGWRQEVVRRMKILAQMAEGGSVMLVHENCSGWAGQGPRQTLELLSEVSSNALKLVFDTGNPFQYGQDAWEYYREVREHVVYLHVKDYARGPDGSEKAVFPGEGSGHVRKIVSDILDRGHGCGFSIEPHITSVIHLGKEADDPDLSYRTYIEYGRRFEQLMERIGK